MEKNKTKVYGRQLVLICLLLLTCGIVYAQEQETIVIDGVTFSADKKTLIKYPADRAGKEYVVPEGVEIIGKKAFGNAEVAKVTLPSTLIHINDSAFYDSFNGLHVVLTDKFPILGSRIFFDKWNRKIIVNDDNPYCYMTEDGYIFSKDEKILHFAPSDVRYTGEAYETIDRYAFQDSFFRWGDVVIPSSVHLIREHAFDDIQPAFPTRLHSKSNSYSFSFSCYALTPPDLEGEVFNEHNFGNSTLYVPKGSEELYRKTPQWNAFGSIKGFDHNPDGILENNQFPLKIIRNDSNIFIEAQKALDIIRLIGLNGSVISEKVISDYNQTSYSIAASDGVAGLLQVVYKDGSVYTVKLYF